MDFYLAGYILVEPYTGYEDYEEANYGKLHPDYNLNSNKEYVIWGEYSKFYPAPWSFYWINEDEKIIENAKINFRLSDNKFKQLQQQSDYLLNNEIIDMPFFYDKEPAIEYYKNFLSNKIINDIKLLGIYASEEFIKLIIEHNDCPLIKNLRQKIKMKDKIKVIGFDLLNRSDLGRNFRMHCPNAVEHLEFELNEYGLLKSYEDVMYIRENADYEKFRKSSEPEQDINKENWLPWVIEDVPLT